MSINLKDLIVEFKTIQEKNKLLDEKIKELELKLMINETSLKNMDKNVIYTKIISTFTFGTVLIILLGTIILLGSY